MSIVLSYRTRLFKRLLITTLFIFTANAHAASSGGYLEISHSTASASIDSARTLALYSPLFDRRREQVYAGLRITEFNLEMVNNDSIVWRVFLGATLEYTVAPFIEVGTDLLGIFLLDNDDKDNDCLDNEKKCRIDGYFRIGFRSVIDDNFIIGAFHESISFGDFHTDLKGDHSYFGISIGTKF